VAFESTSSAAIDKSTPSRAEQVDPELKQRFGAQAPSGPRIACRLEPLVPSKEVLGEVV